MTDNATASADAQESTAPGRTGLVLASLIAVAAVANLGLAGASVALPAHELMIEAIR